MGLTCLWIFDIYCIVVQTNQIQFGCDFICLAQSHKFVPVCFCKLCRCEEESLCIGRKDTWYMPLVRNTRRGRQDVQGSKGMWKEQVQRQLQVIVARWPRHFGSVIARCFVDRYPPWGVGWIHCWRRGNSLSSSKYEQSSRCSSGRHRWPSDGPSSANWADGATCFDPDKTSLAELNTSLADL